MFSVLTLYNLSQALRGQLVGPARSTDAPQSPSVRKGDKILCFIAPISVTSLRKSRHSKVTRHPQATRYSATLACKGRAKWGNDIGFPNGGRITRFYTSTITALWPRRSGAVRRFSKVPRAWYPHPGTSSSRAASQTKVCRTQIIWLFIS